MTKKERALFILKTLNEKGFIYEIKSKSGNIPNHIRVKGFGDIWPSTGTFYKNKRWHKKKFNDLVKQLGSTIPEGKKSNTDRIDELESVVEKLTERLEQMDEELDSVKSFLVI